MSIKQFKYLLPVLVLPHTSIAIADVGTGLSIEQKQHEKRLTELRQQTEILELNHAKAKLIAECRQMGVDCQGQNVSIIEHAETEFESEGQNNQEFQAPAFNTEFDMSTLNHGEPSNTIPSLESIQNQSAQLSLNGSSEWARVGDIIGQWKVIYIDATKVRLQNTEKAKETRTLVIRW